MSEPGHLPECPFGGDTDYSWLDECICDNLRACEARVTERHNAEHEDDRLTAFQNGYAAALDAARGAVAAVSVGGQHFWSVGFRDGTTQALAAIDALRATP